MNKITIICPIYNSYPQIISSLICQTYSNWVLLLIHDGPNNTGLKQIVEGYNDPRIVYSETDDRKHNWGHHLRQLALEGMDIIEPNTDYVVITNPDNYYIPIYLEEMLKGFTSPDIVACYPSAFVHGYLSNQEDGTYRFGVLQSRLELGWIDCGCPMIRKSVACEIGWPNMNIYSDWDFIQSIITKYGEKAFNKVPGTLFVHN